MTESLREFISNWVDDYTWTDFYYTWNPLDDWDFNDAFHPDLMNQIDFSWLKKRMLRDGLADDDNNQEIRSFTPKKSLLGAKFPAMRWAQRFDRFVEDCKNKLGDCPVPFASNEEVTGWARHQDLIFFPNSIWRDE